MANTKATLLSVEDAGPPPEAAPETAPQKSFEDMTPEEQRAEFVRKVMAQRAEDEKEPPPPPPLTERQRSQLEAEMARGKEALKKHEENLAAQRAAQAAAPRDPAEGTTTPVFRPEDYVPNMKQGKAASASARTSNL